MNNLLFDKISAYQPADLDELLQGALDEILDIVKEEVGAIYLIVKRDLEVRLELVVARGLSDKYCTAAKSTPVNNNVPSETLLTGKIITIKDLPSNPNLLDLTKEAKENKIYAVMNFPLIAAGQVIGVVQVFSRESDKSKTIFYTKETQLDLWNLINQLAVAVKNIQRHQETVKLSWELHRRNRELQRTNEKLKDRSKDLEKANSNMITMLGFLYRLSEENKSLLTKMKDNYIKTVESFALALEARDSYSAGHSENVTKLALSIAKKMNLPSDQIEYLEHAGLLHDIGKIGIKEAILHKAGGLTNEEYEHIKKHPVIAKHILEPIEELKKIIPFILYHHERFDGKGYPLGLRGEEIPLESRILAVADTYDAVTSDRPYRKAMPKDKAITILRENVSSQFDPEIVHTFLEILTEEHDPNSSSDI